MKMRTGIETNEAPAAIGPYSQAIQTGNTLYLSGQIGLNPKTMKLVSSDFRAQLLQIIENLIAVTKAAGGDLQSIVKVTVYLLSFDDFPVLNEVMAAHFQAPYPARTTIAVSGLPKEAIVEMDAVMVID